MLFFIFVLSYYKKLNVKIIQTNLTHFLENKETLVIPFIKIKQVFKVVREIEKKTHCLLHL